MYEGIAYGFFERVMFSIILIIIGLYPLLVHGAHKVSGLMKTIWFITCLLMYFHQFGSSEDRKFISNQCRDNFSINC